jgi:hypothetical protein
LSVLCGLLFSLGVAAASYGIVRAIGWVLNALTNVGFWGQTDIDQLLLTNLDL